MKKGLLLLCSVLLASFILHATGVSADAEKFFAGIEIQAWAKGTYVDSATKEQQGKQRLYISSYFNRDLKARIVSTNCPNGLYNGDTGYFWDLKIGDGFNTYYLGDDVYGGESAYAYFAGDKTLYLKTSGFWLDGTNVSGQWTLTVS